MPNPKGTPDNLKPFKTERDEPLTEQLNLRVPLSMMVKLKAIEDYRNFCRQAIQSALDKLGDEED